MTLEQLTGVCFYYWYGSGGHSTPGASPIVLTPQGQDLVNATGKVVSTIKATHRFKLHRAFIDSWIIVPEATSANQNFSIKLNPTEQNFFFDDYFRLMKANGITNIMCVSGLFDWLKVDGYSQRKSACYDHTKEPSDPTAWKDFAHLFRLLATYYKDKDFKPDYIQTGNEKTFRWNVKRILTHTEIAVCDWECIKAIHEADPTQKIMIACTLTPTKEAFDEYISALERLAASEGKALPYSKLVYSDNHYVRDSGGNQGGGLADTPENQWEQTYAYRTYVNTECKKRGMKFTVGEHGYSTSTSTSFSALKQKSPALQGVSHEDAQGVLIWRNMLMLASFSEFIGATLYHCKDGYESEPFTYIGINYDKDFGGKEDWSSKPGKIYLEEQLAKYGSAEVVKYQRINGIYYATLSNGKILHWSDKVNAGTATPMPTETASIPAGPTEPPPPPPNPTTMIIGISKNADRSDFAQLTANANLPAGNYYIEARQATPTVSFSLKKDGIVVKTQNENGAPFDLAGGQPYNLTTGDYELTVKDKTTPAGIVISFTVGTVAPPPPPTKEPVTETYIENGKVYFKTATQTYSTPVQ